MTWLRPAPWLALAPVAMGAALAGTAGAQVIRPPHPERVPVALRYQARATEAGRITDLRSLKQSLAELGFQESERDGPDLDRFDPAAERLTGTLPSKNLPRLLANPFVRGVVVGAPAEGAGTAEVRLELVKSLGPVEQEQLRRQLAEHLTRLGFRESPGYDARGSTVLRGRLPAEALPDLLGDVRNRPGGFVLPAVARDELPAPLGVVANPVRLAEVLPALPSPAAPPAPAALPEAFQPVAGKLTPDLAALLGRPANPDGAGKPTRVELVLNSDPAADFGPTRNRLLNAVPNLEIEGVLGRAVAVSVARPADLVALLGLPEVQAARPPAPGQLALRGTLTADPAPAPGDWLQRSNLAALHARGYRGAGQTVVVILPATPDDAALKLEALDLAGALDPDMTSPKPTDADLRASNALARLVRESAPDARLVVARIDPSSPAMLETLLRARSGESAGSELLATRARSLERRQSELAARRRAAEAEYAGAVADPSDEPVPAERRRAARAEFDKLLGDEARLQASAGRFARLGEQLRSLLGAQVLFNPVAFGAGQPQDGLNPLSRALDESLSPQPVRLSARLAAQRPPRPVWVQAAALAGGATWAGALADRDRNGLVEFAPDTAPVPAGQWSRELNFLGTGDPAKPELAAGTRLTVRLQWREPVPEGQELRTTPQVVVAPRLLRQLDPAGKTVASDEFAEVAVTAGAPVPLLRTARSQTFEQTFEAATTDAGRHALQLGVRPGAAVLAPPDLARLELSLRLVLEGSAPVTLVSYPAQSGGVGAPGDSPAALTVGAAGLSELGAGAGTTLAAKPDVFADGRAGGLEGPAVAAARMAGASACLAQAGARTNDLLRAFGTLGQSPPTEFRLPVEWVESLSPR